MKKVLMLLMFGAMVLTANTVLADAKLASQQGDARLIDNVDLIFMGYANKVVQYQNVLDFRLNDASGSFGSGSGEWGGLIDGKHQDLGVIGIYVNRPWVENSYNGEPSTWAPVGNSSDWDDTAFDTPIFSNGASYPARFFFTRRPVTPSNKVDVFYGKANDNGNFGVGINYADNQTSTFFNNIQVDDEPAVDTDRTRERWARALGATVGLGLKDVGAFNEVNLHAGYAMGMFLTKVLDTANGAGSIANDQAKDDGISTITLGALAQKDLDNDTSMRLFVDAALASFKAKASMTTDSTNDGLHNNGGDDDYQFTSATDNINIALGLGCNHKVNDGAAVVSTGLVGNFSTNTIKATNTTQNGNTATVTNIDLDVDKFDTTTIALWWNGSVDAKLSSWLRARAGIRTAVYGRTTTKQTDNYNYVANAPTNTYTEESTVEIGSTRFSVGFGANFENFTVDANVTAGSLENGSIASIQPGRGLLFGSGDIVTVAQADVKYNF